MVKIMLRLIKQVTANLKGYSVIEKLNAPAQPRQNNINCQYGGRYEIIESLYEQKNVRFMY